MKTNTEVKEYLDENGVSSPNFVTHLLIQGGYIDADPELPKAQQFAEAAKVYLRSCGCTDPKKVFGAASGWDDSGWAFVLGVRNLGIQDKRDIYQALKILDQAANGA